MMCETGGTKLKSLDDVIAEYNRQQNFIMYYCQDNSGWKSDALYYLRNYRNLLLDISKGTEHIREHYLKDLNKVNED